MQRLSAGTLTPAQVCAVELIAVGLSDRAAANRLGISHHTFSHQVSAAMARVGASSRSELVARCLAADVLTHTWPPKATGKLVIDLG